MRSMVVGADGPQGLERDGWTAPSVTAAPCHLPCYAGEDEAKVWPRYAGEDEAKTWPRYAGGDEAQVRPRYAGEDEGQKVIWTQASV